MPFTIGGEWVPGESNSKEQDEKKRSRPVKVRKERRGNNFVTKVLNLNLDHQALKVLASALKKQCGCGGSVKEDLIEIQGDQVDLIRKELKKKGIQAQ